jgi:serine/threonine protein kinase
MQDSVVNSPKTRRYVIVDNEHGEGGFGKVSKQHDTELDRYVAVKELHWPDNAEARERFAREAKVLARFSHPSIPAIYDVEFSDDKMILYFEFIEGDALSQIIKSDAPPSVEECRRWFIQVASALGHAHGKRMIHRDVKPANIIISSDRTTAHLVDFGLALSIESGKRLTESGYVVGTIGYMSPEQLEGKPLDGAADLFSLGMTLYEALAGHLPQAGQPYVSLSDANEAIPPAIDEIICACLVPDKTLRIQSTDDFINRLKNAFRTDVPLSVLLTDARLHELHAALRGMSPEEFKEKPKGQRLFIITRVKDLMRTQSKALVRPTAEMLALLTRLAIYEPENQYEAIVKAAFEWGFTKWYGETWQGDPEIRNSLASSARVSNVQTHGVIAKAFLGFIEGTSLETQPRWYLHELRTVAMVLLANPISEAHAEALAELYDRINVISHTPGPE